MPVGGVDRAAEQGRAQRNAAADQAQADNERRRVQQANARQQAAAREANRGNNVNLQV